MSKRQPKLLLEDILESAEKIITYTSYYCMIALYPIAKLLML